MRLPYPLNMFLSAVESLRDEMRQTRNSSHKDSVRLSDDVKNFKDSVAAHWETDQERRETNAPITTTNLRTNVPITVEAKTKRSKIEILWLAIKSPLEVVGILAVVAYTIVSYNNWQDQADATSAAARQAELSRTGLNETVKQFRISGRAWIKVEIPPFQFESGKAMFANLKLVNIGKTPANKIEGDIQLDLFFKGEKFSAKYGEKTGFAGYRIGQNVLIPGDAYEMPLAFLEHGTHDAQSVKPTNEIMQKIGSGEALPIVYGNLTYFDAFGARHKLRFCKRLLVSGLIAGETEGLAGNFPECGNYDYADLTKSRQGQLLHT